MEHSTLGRCTLYRRVRYAAKEEDIVVRRCKESIRNKAQIAVRDSSNSRVFPMFIRFDQFLRNQVRTARFNRLL